jgi:predicted ribosome quality control (RQC) complex YloA/Tae2 family protein
MLMLTKNQDEISLEISVNPGVPFINLRKKASTPKKNLVDFFTSSLPLIINAVEIAKDDRIIRITCDTASIYFTIRGKYTNIYCITGNDVEGFKKTDEEITRNFQNEISNQKFISTFNNLKIEEEELDTAIARKKYPIIGKEILKEAEFRDGSNSGMVPANVVLNVINEIEISSPAVFIDENSDEIYLSADSFSIFPYTKKENFPDIIKAFNFYLAQKLSKKFISDKKKIIEKHLDRELKKISSKLNDTKARIERGTKEEDYNKIANLLLININHISKGLSKVDLQDIYKQDISISIKLDPRLSPKQNVDLYFEKARNEKIRFERSKKLIPELQEKYYKLKEIKERFINSTTTEDYNSIMKDLNISANDKNKKEDDIRNKFRQYKIQNKYNVYVGKDSKSNDLLTMKFAKQNDYWFHARAVSGSHVVLKNENVKEGIPKNILKAAASIAAYHSKAKTAGMVPVSYTQKKYVVKKKGMDPGKVALLREDVLIVKPDIPAGCEYLNKDS